MKTAKLLLSIILISVVSFASAQITQGFNADSVFLGRTSTSGITLQGNRIWMPNIPAFGSASTKFIGFNGNKLITRTAAQVASDIGAQAALTFMSPLLNTTNQISIPPSDNLTNGYLVSTDWVKFNTAFSQTRQWDGGATGLVAATGRTSLGGSTVGQALFTLTNPSAITFPRINADNSVSALSASAFRTAIGSGTGDGTVTSVSVTTANGVSGSVASATTTPAITLTLGAITPSSVNSVVLSGSSTPTLAVTGTSSISGANTGNVTLGAIGSTPNANGSTLTGQVLNLEPASSSFGGIVTTGTQTIAGNKTFTAQTFFSSSSGVNIGLGSGNVAQLVLDRGSSSNIGYIGFRTANSQKFSVGLKSGDTDFSIYNEALTAYAINVNASTNAITLSSLTTGLVKSTSGVLSNAVANTDYLPVASPTSTGTMTAAALTLSGALIGTSATFSNNVITTGLNGLIVQDASNDSQFRMRYSGGVAQLLSTYTTTGAYRPMQFLTSDAVALSIATNQVITLSSLGTGAVQSTAGVLSVVSDSKAKDLHGGLKTPALNLISNFSVPQFWNYNKKSGLGKNAESVLQFGLLADQVHEKGGDLAEQLAPTQGTYDKDNNFIPTLIDGKPTYGLSDRAIISLLVQGMQELQAEVKALKK